MTWQSDRVSACQGSCLHPSQVLVVLLLSRWSSRPADLCMPLLLQLPHSIWFRRLGLVGLSALRESQSVLPRLQLDSFWRLPCFASCGCLFGTSVYQRAKQRCHEPYCNVWKLRQLHM